MVMIKACCVFMFLLLPLHLFALGEIVVTAEVEGKAQAGQPIQGTLTITHEREHKIDEDSFILEGKPLKAELLKVVQMSPASPLVISIYQFTLEPQPAGLQALPEISVKVGSNTYRSITSTYQVEQAESLKVGDATSSLVLMLENIVDKTASLYPGQRLTVGYRFIFNYSVDLTREELPLLEGAGFRKIGGKESASDLKGAINKVEVTQVLEAVEAGVFPFGPGRIAGKSYKPDRFGGKIYAKSELTAATEPVTITVEPFPERDKPPSFNGAIGEALTFETRLLSSNVLAVGDKLEMLITIKGIGELATLPMPEVCCQPGYSGFFKLGDLPPEEDTFGASKTFKVEMRPLTEKIKAIPSLEFSYFNPVNEKYTALKSRPIPLTVVPLQAPPASPGQLPAAAMPLRAPENDAPAALQLIEIEGNFTLTEEDLTDKLFGTWWVLLMVPLGVAALWLQFRLRQHLEQSKKVERPKESEELFRDALRQEAGSSLFFQLMNQAFISRLYERGEIADFNPSIDHLPETGAAGDVRAFLKEIESRRFSRKEGAFGPEFIVRAKTLFNELKKERA